MAEDNELHGIVKWYSKSSHYGFITTSDNIDYYFNGDDLIGIELDKLDEVTFTPINSTKKFKAKNIKLTKKHIHVEDAVICGTCKRTINPELRTFEVVNKYVKIIKSVEKRYECPHCSHVIGKYEERNGNTYVIICLLISIISITAIYGIYTHL